MNGKSGSTLDDAFGALTRSRCRASPLVVQVAIRASSMERSWSASTPAVVARSPGQSAATTLSSQLVIPATMRIRTSFGPRPGASNITSAASPATEVDSHHGSGASSRSDSATVLATPLATTRATTSSRTPCCSPGMPAGLTNAIAFDLRPQSLRKCFEAMPGREQLHSTVVRQPSASDSGGRSFTERGAGPSG